LTCLEINDAEREVILFDQSRAFAEERRAIEKGNCVKKSRVLAKSDPILVNGLLRIGGRLSRAPLHDDSKHQIIIAKDWSLITTKISHVVFQRANNANYWEISLTSYSRIFLKSTLECQIIDNYNGFVTS